MEPIDINWYEAFSYFISDIEHYHPASTERIGGIIQSILKHRQPSEVTESHPVSWCTLLREIMKILRSQLGCNILPGDETNYAWLDMPYVQQSKPYVDWLLLEACTKRSPEDITEELSRFLQKKAYGSIELLRRITPCQSWRSNPFLVDFQNAHRMQPWSVPIPLVVKVHGTAKEVLKATRFHRQVPSFNIILTVTPNRIALTPKHEGPYSDLESMNGLKQIYFALLRWKTSQSRDKKSEPFLKAILAAIPWSRVRFTVTPNHIALTIIPEELYLDCEGINSLKHLYIAVLRWMASRSRGRKSEPLLDFIVSALKEWIFKRNDTTDTNNKLWSELRAFQDSVSF